MSEWQPIETAPKDGTHLLLAWRTLNVEARMPNAPVVIIGAFIPVMHPDNKIWAGINVPDMDGSPASVSSLTNKFADRYGVGPTHWMPLPEPPK